MEVTLNHSLSYTTKRDVPVSVVAKTLLANERLINESLRILTDVYPDLEIEKINIRVSYLSNASPLKEVFAVALFLVYQKDLEKAVPDLIQQLTGHTVPQNATTLVTVLVMIAAIYVIDAAVDRLFPGKSSKKLKKEYEAKLDELAELTKLPKEKIDSALKKRFADGKVKSVLKKAHDFFLPAKLEEGVEIQIDGRRGISADVIAEVPSDIDYAQIENRNTYEVSGVQIEIHRADVDFIDQGWVAVVTEVSDKRRKMTLSPEINPSELYGKKNIIGDLTVVEEKQIDGDFSVKEYHLHRVIK